MQRPRGDNQQRILDFIKSEIQTKGYPPSVREIAQAVRAEIHLHRDMGIFSGWKSAVCFTVTR